MGKARDISLSLKYYPNRCVDQKAWNVDGMEWGRYVTQLKLVIWGKGLKKGGYVCYVTKHVMILYYICFQSAKQKGRVSFT